jgi:hypothetical protein
MKSAGETIWTSEGESNTRKEGENCIMKNFIIYTPCQILLE